MTDQENKLLEIVTDLATDHHPAVLRRLAERLKQARSARALDTSGIAIESSKTRALARTIEESGIALPEVASLLVGVSHGYQFAKDAQTVELVWTGPSSRLVSTRRTEQALIEIIEAAKRSLFITSFVAYDVTAVTKALQAALARSVAVRLLLEESAEHGGRVSIDGASAMRAALPAAGIYRWAQQDEKFLGGAVHAKVAVADESACFISSANLTGYAMEKNMEAGVVIRGGEVPAQLHRHLGALITTRILQLEE